MKQTASEIIDALGGTSAVARLCEVQPPSVTEWREKGIPRARLMYLRAIRPELFIQPVTCWAICDTDGGRHEPRPLARHIYATQQAADQVARIRFGDVAEFYPVHQVIVQIRTPA